MRSIMKGIPVTGSTTDPRQPMSTTPEPVENSLVNGDYEPDPMSIGRKFFEALTELVFDTYPNHIIETGTYQGRGTTMAIAHVLAWARKGCFYSIECNPEHYGQALRYLQRGNVLNGVRLLHGLSLPRQLMPDPLSILRSLKELPDSIGVDYDKSDREQQYFNETAYDSIPDDLLGLCIAEAPPNIVVLDSAGHLGNIEFNYVLSKLRRRCFIALDDVRHVKHFRSLQQIKADKRFKLIFETDEKFGSVIADFTPQ